MSIIAGSSPTITIMGVGIVGMFLLCMYLINVINRSRKYGYLTTMMGVCVQKNMPLGLIVDRAGQVIPFMIERSDKNRGLVKHDLYTLVHPDLVDASVTRMRIKNGPEMVIYPMPYFFPFSVQSASALSQVADDISKDPDFNWMPSQLRIIELLFNGTETFERDAEMIIRGAVVNGYPVPDSWYPIEEIDEVVDEDTDDEFEEKSQLGGDY